MIAGIIEIVGDQVPIVGGSAADNAILGAWSVFDRDKTASEGVAVSVLFQSTPLSMAYQNGYAPTQQEGMVNRAAGRTIFEINDTPAAEVLSEWSDGAVCASMTDEPKAILADSTLWPLGGKLTAVGEVATFLMAHPSTQNQDGSVELPVTDFMDRLEEALNKEQLEQIIKDIKRKIEGEREDFCKAS